MRHSTALLSWSLESADVDLVPITSLGLASSKTHFEDSEASLQIFQ
jgi:hypothetical protein